MFGPSYQAGCPINSSIADTIDGLIPHLNAHDVTMILASGAPLEKLRAYKRRMGWSIPWVSSAHSDFNADLGYSSERGRDAGVGRRGAAGRSRRSSNATPARAAPTSPGT